MLLNDATGYRGIPLAGSAELLEHYVVLVCGGRDYSDRRTVFRTLDKINYIRAITKVIHGDATGADRLGDEWARVNGVVVTRFLANWVGFGRSAGVIRNQLMLDVGKPDLVVAFTGGRGTADMARRSHFSGGRVIRVGE